MYGYPFDTRQYLKMKTQVYLKVKTQIQNDRVYYRLKSSLQTKQNVTKLNKNKQKNK